MRKHCSFGVNVVVKIMTDESISFQTIPEGKGDYRHMKAICNNCRFEVSGADREELDDNYRGHAMAFGHAGFCIVNYD